MDVLGWMSGHQRSRCFPVTPQLTASQTKQTKCQKTPHADTVVGMTSSSASSSSLCVNLVCVAASSGGSETCRNHNGGEASATNPSHRSTDECTTTEKVENISRIRTTSIYVVGDEGGASAGLKIKIKLPK